MTENHDESIEAAIATPGSEGADINVDDPSFSIRKLPDEVAAHPTTSASGLGAGTPKVCPLFSGSFICCVGFSLKKFSVLFTL